MRKLTLPAVLVAGLGFAAFAHADDTTTSETKMEKTTSPKKAHSKVEKKTKTDPAGMGNSTTDSSSTEMDKKPTAAGGSEETTDKTVKHDAPGMKHDKKAHTKETVKKDAEGNVVSDEKTTK